MRLPGTFNLGGRNNLPSAEFLIHYEKLKRAKRQARLEALANDTQQKEFGDKPPPKSQRKQGADANRHERPDVVTTPDGDTFTREQDATIIKMKIEGKTWAQIGAEIGGKDKGAVSSRFKDIKPADFEAQEREWNQKNGGGGNGGGNKGQKNKQKDNNNQNNQNQQKAGKAAKNQNQQNNQNNQESMSKKERKALQKQQNEQQQQSNDQSKKKGAQADAGADADTVSDAGTWAVPDENFTLKEVTVLEKIVEIELRNSFVRIAKSFAQHPDGKKVHPDSIATKVLGEALDLSSLTG